MTPCLNGSIYTTVNVVRYEPQKRCDEQVNDYHAVKQLDENLHTSWRKELLILN